MILFLTISLKLLLNPCYFREMNSIEDPLVPDDEKAEAEVTNLVCYFCHELFGFLCAIKPFYPDHNVYVG
jgi:hypothetical protein